MSLLSIVFVFLLARYTVAGNGLHRDAPVNALLGALAQRWPQRWLAFAVLPMFFSLLLALLLYVSGFWLAFFFGVLVLLYAVGRGDWSKGMHDLALQLKEGNAEAVWLCLEEKGFVSGGDGTPGQGLWLAWRRCAGCWYLDRLFAVFFWFFVLGPAGAVFYRWLVLYNRHPQTLANRLPSAVKLQHAFEWLPVRYMGLCACLAGNFTTGFRVWQQRLLDMQVSSADFLAQCLDATLVLDSATEALPMVDESVRQTLLRSAALEALMVRTEIIGLVGLALAILVVV